jgi:hypothetical protein
MIRSLKSDIRQWPPQAQAPPHAQPPADAPVAPVLVAKSENRRRTDPLPHEGHATRVSTAASIGRVISNRCSHAPHAYS